MGRDPQAADFRGADLRGVGFSYTNLQNADFGYARLDDSQLFGAMLQGAHLERAQLYGADVRNARLDGADLVDAGLQAAYLEGSTFHGANLRGAILQAADFTDADLQGADLSYAQLQGANLRDANIHGAGLRWAQLQGTDLERLQADDAEFEGTFVTRALLTDAKLDSSAIYSVHSEMVMIRGDMGPLIHPKLIYRYSEPISIEPLTQANVDDWTDAAMQFVTTEKSAASIAKRFDRLKPNFQTTEQDARDDQVWKSLEVSSSVRDPAGTQHRQRLASFLGDLACDLDGAPHVARGLVTGGRSYTGSRLSELGDQLDTVRNRMKAGREQPDACKGVAGFTENDWRRLDEIQPAED